MEKQEAELGALEALNVGEYTLGIFYFLLMTFKEKPLSTLDGGM